MAATKKCLARSNKSRHVIRMDIDRRNGRVGHARSGLRRTHGAPSAPPRQKWRGRRDVLLSEKGMKTL